MREPMDKSGFSAGAKAAISTQSRADFNMKYTRRIHPSTDQR